MNTKKIINFSAIAVILTFSSCSHQNIVMDDGAYTRNPASFIDCFKVMETLFERPAPIRTGLTFETAKDLDELESLYKDDSFIEVQRALSNERINDLNTQTRKILTAPLVTDTPDGLTNYITKEEGNFLYKELANDKVHKNHSCYDPKGTVGFCFGRATIVHMEALIRGINPDSIRKVWIAGDMDKWGHHVATMIKSKDGWYVIDTNLGELVTVEKWIDHYKPFKKKGAKDIMVFVTRADRFAPYNSQNYSGINLFNTTTGQYDRSADYYRGYFQDYFEALDKERKEVEKFPVRK